MRLSQYLTENKLSDRKFAEKMGCHLMTIYRIRSGISFPKKSTLNAIVEETGGQVTANDFLGIERPLKHDGRRGRPRKTQSGSTHAREKPDLEAPSLPSGLNGPVRVADPQLVYPHDGKPQMPPASASGAPRLKPQAAARPSATPAVYLAPEDIPKTIARLAALRQEDIITEEEFSAKKAELLARL